MFSFSNQAKSRYVIPACIVIVALLCAVILVQCSKKEGVTQVSETPVQVKTVTTAKGDFSPTLVVYGQAVSSRRILLSAKSKADVAKVMITDGQHVNAEQPLVLLDDYVAKLAYNRAKQTKDADQATLVSQAQLLELKKKDLARKQALFDRKLISDKSLDTVKSEWHQQQIQVNLQQAKLSQSSEAFALAQKALNDHQLLAPVNSVVTHVYVASHQQVSIGQKVLQLLPVDEIEVRGLIPTPYLAVLQQALESGKKVQAVSLFSSGSVLFNLKNISARVNAGQIGREAIFKAHNMNSDVVDGQHFTLRLMLPEERGVFKLPLSALYYGNHIYKVVNSRLQSVSVKVKGRIYGDKQTFVLIKSNENLQSCEPIVVSAMSDPINGMLVKQSNTKDSQCQ